MDAATHLDAARQHLLSEIAGFIVERGVTETTFGRLAVNDGKFVARLRSGAPMTDSLIKRAAEWIKAERGRAGEAA